MHSRSADQPFRIPWKMYAQQSDLGYALSTVSCSHKAGFHVVMIGFINQHYGLAGQLREKARI